MPARIAPLAALLVTLLASARLAAADSAPQTSAIPLRYGIERPLVLGVRVEVAPAVLVTRDARGTQLVGYSGTVKLKAYADLVIVKSEVETLSRRGARRPTTAAWPPRGPRRRSNARATSASAAGLCEPEAQACLRK